MSEPIVTPISLQPHLEACGYTSGSRLISNYRFNDETAPFAGFYSRPFDARSACLLVVESNGNTKAAASRCLPAGAPTVLVCDGPALEWWALSPDGPTESRRFRSDQIHSMFSTHRDDLSPQSIYSAKLRRPTDGSGRPRQLWFVDVGLMPATERNSGEMLQRMVENLIQDFADHLGNKIQTKKHYEDLYKTVFWLLAAKLLREKQVEGFKTIDLTDVTEVFRRVGRHYADMDDLPPGGTSWQHAVNSAGSAVARWGYLGNISTESLAYLYEKALIDKKPRHKIKDAKDAHRDIRKELGIHSTPPVLIDHMLSQLWPLVEQHKPEDRQVFEPACGPASFLVATMRWLRDFSGITNSTLSHRYLRDHLYGIEVEPFAREVAKLSLTLADVPHGNSWHIDRRDMFMDDVLVRGATNCSLFLANPPFERFTSSQHEEYRQAGSALTAVTKAGEMLKRTLPNLPVGAVFGIVLPQGALYDTESSDVRQFIIKMCDLLEIDLFADKLFEESEHEVAVIMGQRRDTLPKRLNVSIRRVRETSMQAFKERLAFSSEELIEQTRFAETQNYSLFVTELDDVWSYLGENPALDTVAEIGQGLSHKAKDNLPTNTWRTHQPPRKGDDLGYYNVSADSVIYHAPPIVGINLDPRVVATFRHGRPSRQPQILLNYGRTSREPWRLKAFIDMDGLAFSSRFLGIRPKTAGSDCIKLWAILNSPVANAFAHSQTMKRDNPAGMLRKLPLPAVSWNAYERVTAAANRYLSLARKSGAFMEIEPTEDEIKQALLYMDAEILRLYDLPPRLERQLLDIFAGVRRRGVGCTFANYYPAGLTAFIPLHELISVNYARSTAGRFRTRHASVDSELVTALRLATEAFAEE